MTIAETFAVFTAGAAGYGLIEILWRGRTHWSMLITGGLCFLFMYIIANFSHMQFWKQILLSAAVVTTLEFLCGIVVNLHFGWAVWDYSDMPGNILGQICPAFSIGWLLLSIPAMPLCRGMKNLISLL